MRDPEARLDWLAHDVIGTAIEVHRTLGPGYDEAVYQAAMEVELGLRGIPFARQVVVTVEYKGQEVGRGKLDLLIDGSLVVELKAVEELGMLHTAQVISYLKATGLELGLLINFNVPVLKAGVRRIVFSGSPK